MMSRRFNRLILFTWVYGACFVLPIFPQAPVQRMILVTNAGTTGTSNNTLTKLTGAPSTAVIAATTDTGGVVGVTVTGAGTTGQATIQTNGKTLCVFPASVVAGDYVQISAATAGNCTDAGATYPTTGQVIGRVLQTASGAGTYNIDLFAFEIQAVSAPASTPGYLTTSATSNTIANGSHTFTVGAGLLYSTTLTTPVLITETSNTANFLLAQLTSYSGTTLVVNVFTGGGSGTHTDWTIDKSSVGTVANAGTNLPPEPILNIVSGGCVDNPSLLRTDCTVASGLTTGPTGGLNITGSVIDIVPAVVPVLNATNNVGNLWNWAPSGLTSGSMVPPERCIIGVTGCAVLPAASSVAEQWFIIKDGASVCDLTTGSGTTRVLTQSNGSAYVAPNCSTGSSGIANTTVTVTGATQNANTCSTPATTTMTGLLTTSAVIANYSSNPTSLTGWGSTGGMVFQAWPSASSTLSHQVCNQTISNITFSTITFNVGAN